MFAKTGVMKYNLSMFDVIFLMPYSFSDHPSFPEGILKRVLESEGYSVGIVERPFWQKPESFMIHGKPRLFFAVIAGPVDSVVLNYTSSGKRRYEDLYQADGNSFFEGYPPSVKYKIRPDRTVTNFINGLKKVCRDIPVITGGVEASLRRFVHYDFKKEALMRPLLFDSRADLIVTGMGERQIVDIAGTLDRGDNIKDASIPGTAFISSKPEDFTGSVELPSYEELKSNPAALVEAYNMKAKAQLGGRAIIQQIDNRYVVDLPGRAVSSKDLDRIYSMEFTREHSESGKFSSALSMNLFSITSHRGCGGGCGFCSISLHEGKRVVSRSEDSIIEEIERLRNHKRWKGVISDIGGASAEMYGMDCTNNRCVRESCIVDTQCKSFCRVNRYFKLLGRAEKVKGVKQIFVGSGLRYDLLLKEPELLERIMAKHTGKFLRVAPEHTESSVLSLMRKPGFENFEKFVELFNRINRKLKRPVELAPYLITGYPGETWNDVKEMKKKLKRLKLKSTDVQIFTPTPGTLATAMYYGRIDSVMNSIEVAGNMKEILKRKNYITGGGRM